MNKIKFSTMDIVKLFGCLIFDIAIILTFCRSFGLFVIITPAKSLISFFVLLFGLLILNLVAILSRFVYKSIGVTYTAAIIILSVIFFVISNIISLFLITASVIFYLALELIVLACFLFIFSTILSFLKVR